MSTTHADKTPDHAQQGFAEGLSTRTGGREGGPLLQAGRPHGIEPALQRLADSSPRATAFQGMQAKIQAPLQRKDNQTGLPDGLKSGVEQLSGLSLEDVKVHYNSAKPAQLQAHAYAQGSDIHVAPGQEQHLAHEAWHVVQQKQGRVRPTTQMKGKIGVNDDGALEHEADVMGARAMQLQAQPAADRAGPLRQGSPPLAAVQRLAVQYGTSAPIPQDAIKIATAQDGERGAVIAVQMIGSAIGDEVYGAMGDAETIYIVAHGRAPIGNEPAILQESGQGATMSGGDVAAVISAIRSGLAKANKKMGAVKIEACMSSLSRKTESGMFGETFVKAKPSLLTDIQTSLQNTYKVSDVTVRGNPGFSTGNEEDGNVENLSPQNTELGLLASIIETLYDVKAKDWAAGGNSALRKDGLNIVRKYGTALEAFHKNSQVKELIQLPTAELVKNYLGADAKSEEMNGEVINVVNILNGYIRGNPA